MSNNSCAICLKEMNNEMQSVSSDGDYRLCYLDCGHCYHCLCIFELVTKSRPNCPLCRKHIETIKVVSRYNLDLFVSAKINYDMAKKNSPYLKNIQKNHSNNLTKSIVIFILFLLSLKLLTEINIYVIPKNNFTLYNFYQ